MADTYDKEVTDEILGSLGAYHAAMVAARTDQLAVLVESEYSLAHITGYVQPKEEWFDVIRTRQFDYHRIDIEESSLSLASAAVRLRSRAGAGAGQGHCRRHHQRHALAMAALVHDELVKAGRRIANYVRPVQEHTGAGRRTPPDVPHPKER